MQASDDRVQMNHHWRCRQDPDDIERRARTDLDVAPPARVPVFRCRCGAWAPVEGERDV